MHPYPCMKEKVREWGDRLCERERNGKRELRPKREKEIGGGRGGERKGGKGKPIKKKGRIKRDRTVFCSFPYPPSSPLLSSTFP